MDVRPARPMPGEPSRMISETWRGREQARKGLPCKSYNARYRVFTLLAYARRGAEAS